MLWLMALVQVMCWGSSQHRCANPAVPARCTGNFRTNKSAWLNCENSQDRDKSFTRLGLHVFYAGLISVPCKVHAACKRSCSQSTLRFNKSLPFDFTPPLNSWVWPTKRWFIFHNGPDCSTVCKADYQLIRMRSFTGTFAGTSNSQGLVAQMLHILYA